MLTTRFTRHYLPVGAFLLLSACVAGERRDQTIERSWPAAAVRAVHVDGIDGDLVVQSGKPDVITLVARVRSRGLPRAENAENHGYFQTEIVGDTLRIGQTRNKTRVRLPFVTRRRLQIDYALRVPERIALELRTVNGKIATRGIAGATNVTLVNGSIDAEVAGEGDFRASTVNGRIRAKFVRDFKGAHLKTVNGRVQALLPPTASFRCSLSQVNGDFEASFPLSIHSHPGSRRVSGEVNGGQYQLQITTVNGDVKVDRFGVPEVPDPPEPPADEPLVPETPSLPPPPGGPPVT